MSSYAKAETLVGALAAPLDWTRFSVHWSTVVGLAAFGAAYLARARAVERAVARQRASSGDAPLPSELAPSAGQRAMFFAGVAVMFLALNGPLHDLSDYYLFSAHMVQHLLLTLVVAPLFVAGTTGAMLRPLLGMRGVGAAARWLTGPRVCFVVFNVVLAAWHLPVLYNLAMASHPVHIVQHLCFLAAAVLMWWPLLSPLPELPRLSYPLQMLYAFLMTIPMTTVSIYIVYAESVLYPAYASAPRLWAISPLQDQLIGGLIMWVPGGLFFLGVLTVIFFTWVAREGDDAATAQVDYVGSRV